MAINTITADTHELVLTMTQREANIVRSALALYASQGADGTTGICDRIVEAQYAADVAANGGNIGGDDHYDYDDGMTAMEADEATLRSCGWGTDEDYG